MSHELEYAILKSLGIEDGVRKAVITFEVDRPISVVVTREVLDPESNDFLFDVSSYTLTKNEQ